MKYYEKPIVLANEELAEGVYAASGGNCWEPSIFSVQDYVDGKHVFEVHNSHTTSVEHISAGYTVQITCSAPVTSASAENNWACSISGNVVTVTRTSHANGYKSGDETSFKVWIGTGDEATTKSLTATITCTNCDWQVNVQGNGANGN